MKTKKLIVGVVLSCLIGIGFLSKVEAGQNSVTNIDRVITDNRMLLDELNAFDDRWFDAFDSQNVPALYEFYSPSSIFAFYPFDQNAILSGVDDIATMYRAGAFTFLTNPVLTASVFLNVISDNYGLQIKQWNVTYKLGASLGMVFKVIHHDENGWKRSIDYIVEGVGSLDEVESLEDDHYDPLIFNPDEFYAQDHQRISQCADINRVERCSQPLIQGDKITVKTFIPNMTEGTALLIAKHEKGNESYLVISALKLVDGKWQAIIDAKYSLDWMLDLIIEEEVKF